MTWQEAYITALGGKPTPQAIAFLNSWQPWEGGATKNNASYNYFNTTLKMPGSKTVNDHNVQAYGSLAQGAKAFAKTLLSGDYVADYAPLVHFIRTGQGDPTPGLSTWLSGSPNSAAGLHYAAKILGHPSSAMVPTVGGAPGAAPTSPSPSATPLAAPVDPQARMTQIRSAAADNFAQIAQGHQSPEQGFGNMVDLLKTLKVSVPHLDPVLNQQANTAPDSLEGKAANLVRKYLGVPYVWGGTTPKGFDCSGLIQTVWKQLGVSVPRTSQQQWKYGTPTNDPKPGDTVFFVGSDGTPSAPGHEGMYIGNGKYIAAPHTGAVVSVLNLADAKDYVGARTFA